MTAGDTSHARGSTTVPNDRLSPGTTTVVESLYALARNLWWTWQPDLPTLFRDLAPDRWRALGHNPTAVLAELSPDAIERRCHEARLHDRIHEALRRLRSYLRSHATWGEIHAGVLMARPVAYFSAEFGIHESLPIYSGGLGVLAGDHVKSASDLGVPLVAVGLFYDQGYFHQCLTAEGRQEEAYVDLAVERLPLDPVNAADGRPLVLEVPTRTGAILARVWRAAVGRVTLFLLDSNCEGNGPEDRTLTARLYGGDRRTRIRQELVLGIGGVRALRALGITPGVYHLNEGHSAFAPLEAIRELMACDDLGFDEASRRVAQSTCFTTHTPVPAGHDCFSADMIEEHLGPTADSLGLTSVDMMALGQLDAQNPAEEFCMTVLALRLSRRTNAVSALHGHVSRRMWQSLWPERPPDDVPIGHVTNGVHVGSWLAAPMRRLFDRHLDRDWRARSAEPEAWLAAEALDDAELWETHQALKGRLIAFVRRRVDAQGRRRGDDAEVAAAAAHALDPDILTIGFARRFATYKRASLVLEDFERLVALLTDAVTPIQLLFAGKAHPKDEPGKDVLQRIARLARDPAIAPRLVFVEDYDIDVGRHLVQGVDVWLNTPRRPLEACGTSGQKVVLNGGLNLSVLDGWWAEAYDGLNGFAIGQGGVHPNVEVQDRRDAEHLQRVLRDKVVPLYYGRDADGLPRGWIARMKRSIRTLGWRFGADRMVRDYVRECYLRAANGDSCRMPP